MRDFLQNTFRPQKLQELYAKSVVSNFVGYVAGSLVMLTTTYSTVEQRAIKNLFGVLPRRKVVVHMLPEWLEWTLSILLGYLVMEFVRYIIQHKKYALLFGGSATDKSS